MPRRWLLLMCACGVALALRLLDASSISHRDFVNIWSAGRAVLRHANPYDSVIAVGPGRGEFNFPYPPHALLLAIPLSLLPLTTAFVIWNCATSAFFVWAAHPHFKQSFVALLTPAAIICMLFGQTGLICGGLWLLVFRGSGLALSALTFKPQMAFLAWPALSCRQLIIAIVGTAVLLVASLPFGMWSAFLNHSSTHAGQLVGHARPLWLLTGTTPMIGYGAAGWILYAAGAAYFLCRNFNVWTAATATFLISPYGFHYDMTVACLGFLFALNSHWERMKRWERASCMAAYLSPGLVFYLSAFAIPPILLLGLHVQSRYLEGVTIRIPLLRKTATSPAELPSDMTNS